MGLELGMQLYHKLEEIWFRFQDNAVDTKNFTQCDKLDGLASIIDSACFALGEFGSHDGYNILFGVIHTLYATDYIDKNEYTELMTELNKYKTTVPEIWKSNCGED